MPVHQPNSTRRLYTEEYWELARWMMFCILCICSLCEKLCEKAEWQCRVGGGHRCVLWTDSGPIRSDSQQEPHVLLQMVNAPTQMSYPHWNATCAHANRHALRYRHALMQRSALGWWTLCEKIRCVSELLVASATCNVILPSVFSFLLLLHSFLGGFYPTWPVGHLLSILGSNQDAASDLLPP